MEKHIQPMPLSSAGRALITLIIVGILGIWVLGIYAYVTLPQTIPAHYGLNGEPTRYGNKSTFLILPFAFSLAPLIFLLFARYRFTVINNYPYLVNLPAFFIYLPKVKEERKGIWINRYTEALLCLGMVLTFSFLMMEGGIFWGEVHKKLPVWFLPFTLSMPVWLIVPFLLYLRKLNTEIQAEIQEGKN